MIFTTNHVNDIDKTIQNLSGIALRAIAVEYERDVMRKLLEEGSDS